MLEGSPAPATMNSKRRVVSSSRSAVAVAEGTLDVEDVVDASVVTAAVLQASVQLMTAGEDVIDGETEERLSVALAKLLADEDADEVGKETYKVMVRQV